MLKSFIKHTNKFILCSLISISFLGCAYFQKNSNKTSDIKQDLLAQSKQLVSEKKYELAVTQLNKNLVEDPSRKSEYLLLLARCYDQTSQPEKAILSLKELSEIGSLNLEQNIKLRSLSLKNQSKIGIVPNTNQEKTQLQQIVQSLLRENNQNNLLEPMLGSLDFQCDQYCVQEIQYFQELQTVLILILEKQSFESEKIKNLIQSKYQQFQQSAKAQHLDPHFKRAILAQLLESYKTLSRLQIITPTPSSLKTAQLIQSLKYLEKQIEQEMYN